MLEDLTERKQLETEAIELQRRFMEGREEERLHLARELHDGPIQDLYGQIYSLKAFSDRLPANIDREPLLEMQNSLQQVIRTLRAVMLLCGCRTPGSLALAPRIIGGELRSWLEPGG